MNGRYYLPCKACGLGAIRRSESFYLA